MHELPYPLTTDHHYLAALVTRLDRQNALLADILDRLSSGPVQDVSAEEEGTVRLLEPDVRPEPSRSVVEPDIPEPPRHGKGSGRPVWAAHADALGVPYPPNARQRDIIAAVDAAKT